MGWLSPQANHGGQLYVADQTNQRVAIFSQKTGQPTGQITDAIAGPDGLYIDHSGTLYVCNFSAGTVTEYPKGQTTHSKTLTGTIGPKYVVAGRDGTVYVSDFGDGSNSNLYEYANGSTTPTTTIPFTTYPAGIALDTHNKLYVAYNDSTNSDIEVLKFTPGSTKGKNLGIHVIYGNAGGLTFDKNRDLLLDDQALPGVDVFPPGATSPSQQITGFSLAYQIALNRKDTDLFVSDPFGPSVAEVAYPSGTPVQTFSSGLSGAFGVATSPDSPY
jgi:sugar lactone lactonase YvrE